MKVKSVCFTLVLISIIEFGFAQKIRFRHLDYEKGISHNHVMCAVKDHNGFMWFGTINGLNRYDGNSFKVFKHSSSKTSIPYNTVQNITVDQLGRFWLDLQIQKCSFNPITEEFISDITFTVAEQKFSINDVEQIITAGDSLLIFTVPGTGILVHNIFTNTNSLISQSSNKISSNYVTDIAFKDKTLWIIHERGIIEGFDILQQKIVFQDYLPEDITQKQSFDFQLDLDPFDNIWIYSKNSNSGLIKYSTAQQSFKTFNTRSEPALNSNQISAVVWDDNGKYWIGTDHGGINVLDKDFKKIEYLTHNNNEETSISQNVVTSIYKDDNNIIWVNTFKKGVNFYHKDLFQFQHIKNNPIQNNSLPYNDVNCFEEDKKGNLWIGTNGEGLLYYNRKNDSYTAYKYDSNKPNSIAGNVIVSLLIDRNDKLWIGTYRNGLSCFNGTQFTNYRSTADTKSISDNNIWDIYEDSKGHIWIGTLKGGLDRYDSNNNSFIHYKGNDHTSVSASFIMDITEDADENLWLASNEGIYILNQKSGRIQHIFHEPHNAEGLSGNFVYSLHCDRLGNMWAGTRNGLNLYQSKNGKFVKFSTENGLPNNSIMDILDDKWDNIWVSTSNGVSRINLGGDINDSLVFLISNYTKDDGLQEREFNEGSGFKTSQGELIFGGSNGFNLFMPRNEKPDQSNHETYITHLTVLGIDAGTQNPINNRTIVRSSILNNQQINLNYEENIFSLEFTGINFLEPRKIKYRYKLEGFNQQWFYPKVNERKATFTNLSPGAYTFIVQSSLNDKNWDESTAKLSIVVNAPWYRTKLAYIGYLLSIIFFVFFLTRSLIERERIKFLALQSERESYRQKELNTLKTRFFTNISHEFRTPLSLLISPLEGLLKTVENSSDKKQLILIHKNAKRLLYLVNQLLDFRKIEANQIKINLGFGNIIEHIEQSVYSFNDLKESKNIQLSFTASTQVINMQFDRDKLEKILFNLLSNAFKFTPEGGEIFVHVQLSDSENKERLLIRVTDTGIGIPEEKTAEIFQLFYQNDLSADMLSNGSGIGLSITKEFVELHQGKITAQNNQGKGSTFIVELPVNRAEASINAIIQPLINYTENKDISTHKRTDPQTEKTILLVEDNHDFRFYLRDNLQHHYRVIEAENGRKALEILKEELPDLVVSDVMMPEIDGLKLCETIKNTAEYSHLPVILLTAKATTSDKIEGYNLGADEYITKPFSFEILVSRIGYLLKLRNQFIKKYQKDLTIETKEQSISSLDKKLLERTRNIVETNLTDTNFNVEMLSTMVGLSRVHLYKKLMALTGRPPVEFIRLIRLKKATDLLKNSELNISEIAYDTGFNDPRYFTKLFKREFGISPSQFREQV